VEAINVAAKTELDAEYRASDSIEDVERIDSKLNAQYHVAEIHYLAGQYLTRVTQSLAGYT
jgi:hypothetical protein